MSRIDQLLGNYKSYLQIPLKPHLAAGQRIWFAVYPAVEERRIANRIDEFEMATKAAGNAWVLIDLKGSLARWLASIDEEERAQWFTEADDIELYARTEWIHVLAELVMAEFAKAPAPERTIFAVTGLMDLFDYIHVSDFVEAVQASLPGFLLVFFPGERQGNTYRFLNARVGWDYLAVPILSEK